NCGGCGYPGCDGLAAAIALGKASVNACPVGGQAVADKVAEIMGLEAAKSVKKVAYVKCAGNCDAAKFNADYTGLEDCRAATVLPGGGTKACRYGCKGLGTCVKACQFDAIHIINGVAVVDRNKCVACGKCIEVCPNNLIEIIPDSADFMVTCSSQSRGKAVKDVCSNGCIGCTLCTRKCDHGAITMQGNVAHINQDECVECGACVMACPSRIIRKRV
ncbi:MAG: RnfABCDGE type electron transport complex subunit B, partial [Holdemanella sp.]|nr:RnfABCDGE type electron transport complex subunit B [Holdemanella sp.]